MRGKHIVIGVTGGIAAYKAVYLVRQLQETGARVRVTMTQAATRFVGGDTFAAITRHDVPVHIFPDNPSGINENWTQHIHWAEWADIIVIAPCTANSLAKIVHGFSDSMLTTTIMAARCPVLICPTMDGEMYRAPATRYNLKKAVDMGFHLLAPDHGYLASGIEGVGRLPDTEVIIDRITQILEISPASKARKKKPGFQIDHPEENEETAAVNPSVTLRSVLAGKKVLVTCGPTREYLDPVRFLSNPSTGKMGMAMAAAASAHGAHVTLLHSQSVTTTALSPSINKKNFVSTQDLFDLVREHSDSDIIIMTAAVSDFRPVNTYNEKVKKEEAELQINLERTPDILQWLGEQRKKGQVLIGFAMETSGLEKNAREKRIRKGADWIVANDLGSDGSGFASDTNRVVLVGAHSEVPFEGTKFDVSRNVLQHIFAS